MGAEGRLTLLKNLRSEMGNHPVYAFKVGNQSVALFQPGMGAPFAAVLLDEVIALGCRKFIACGGAGVLDREIALGHLLRYCLFPALRCLHSLLLLLAVQDIQVYIFIDQRLRAASTPYAKCLMSPEPFPSKINFKR